MKKSSKGHLFIVSAPSGAGKTTLVNALIGQVGQDINLKKVVTYTTKTPRAGEIDQVDYYFVSQAEFKKRIAEQFFLEWSDAYGAYYGTPRSILDELAKGTSFIAIVDRTGAQALAGLVGDACLLWVCPPSLDILKKRLELRGTEDPVALAKRLALAKQEMAQEIQSPFFHHKIMNDSFESALSQMKKIILFYVGYHLQ